MSRIPAANCRIVLKRSMLERAMLFFANVSERDPLLAFLADAEASRIPRPVRRTPGAMARVAEVTVVKQLFIRRDFAMMLRRGAIAFPASAQRKASRVNPQSRIMFFCGH